MNDQASREMTLQEMLDCGTYTKDDIIRILEARLFAHRALSHADLTPKWQSMDTAPRGRSILVMTTMAKAGRPNEICVVANSMWHEREDGSGLWLDLEGIMSQDAPEYWMDIPPPPATTTGDGE